MKRHIKLCFGKDISIPPKQLVSSELHAKTRKDLNAKKKTLPHEAISILKAYIILDNLHMKNIFIKITDLFKNLLNRNLHSKDPNLFLFDLYRLNYLCKIKNA